MAEQKKPSIREWNKNTHLYQYIYINEMKTKVYNPVLSAGLNMQ